MPRRRPFVFLQKRTEPQCFIDRGVDIAARNRMPILTRSKAAFSFFTDNGARRSIRARQSTAPQFLDNGFNTRNRSTWPQCHVSPRPGRPAARRGQDRAKEHHPLRHRCRSGSRRQAFEFRQASVDDADHFAAAGISDQKIDLAAGHLPSPRHRRILPGKSRYPCLEAGQSLFGLNR